MFLDPKQRPVRLLQMLLDGTHADPHVPCNAVLCRPLDPEAAENPVGSLAEIGERRIDGAQLVAGDQDALGRKRRSILVRDIPRPAMLAALAAKNRSPAVEHQIIRHPVEIGHRVGDRARSDCPRLQPQILQQIVGVVAGRPRPQESLQLGLTLGENRFEPPDPSLRQPIVYASYSSQPRR